MSKWYKVCNQFEKVREMIDDDIETTSQCMRIMYALESCCDELTPNNAKNWSFYDDFRDLKSEIHDEVELMDEDDYEACEDTVNYYLGELYDLCDSARVWLSL